MVSLNLRRAPVRCAALHALSRSLRATARTSAGTPSPWRGAAAKGLRGSSCVRRPGTASLMRSAQMTRDAAGLEDGLALHTRSCFGVAFAKTHNRTLSHVSATDSVTPTSKLLSKFDSTLATFRTFLLNWSAQRLLINDFGSFACHLSKSQYYS